MLASHNRCYNSSRCKVPVSCPRKQQSRAARRTRQRSHRLPIVATSEFWWEDEQEFDALTEVLLPKQVVICTPLGCQQQLQQLQAVRFVAAFSSPTVKQEAEQAWEQLGRAGPPLFLRVRTRDALHEVEQEGSKGTAAAEAFWQELTSQSWRMDLDYGLNKDATLSALAEQLLVVVGSDTCLHRLAAAAVGDTGDGSSDAGSSSSSSGGSSGVCVVDFTGWNQGEKQQQLQSWRQLQPQLGQLPSGAVVNT